MRNYLINQENTERYEELYDQAVITYLNKTDFNAADWLDKEDQTEFNKLLEDNK